MNVIHLAIAASLVLMVPGSTADHICDQEIGPDYDPWCGSHPGDPWYDLRPDGAVSVQIPQDPWYTLCQLIVDTFHIERYCGP